MMKEPYAQFDRKRLKLEPLANRENNFHATDIAGLESSVPVFDNPLLPSLAADLRRIKQRGGIIVLAMGAHVIRSGVSRYIIDLLHRGSIDHICFNGACAIHDYELALTGATTESVARYIVNGRFGMWSETGEINSILYQGLRKSFGFGQAVGHAIAEGNYPWRNISILYHAYECGVPVTVHSGIGYDIIHQHPSCDGAILGESSYMDFLVFVKSLERIDNGAYLSAGTAVMGPEIFLKGLSMVRNAYPGTCRGITTGVFDLVPIDTVEYSSEPDKSDNRYYFRPWKTLLVRTVSDGGKSYYIQGRHEITIPNLYQLLLKPEG